jgi:hypothetical protein
MNLNLMKINSASFNSTFLSVKHKIIRTHKQQQAGPSGRSLAWIVGSNSTEVMEVCLLWLLCVVR